MKFAEATTRIFEQMKMWLINNINSLLFWQDNHTQTTQPIEHSLVVKRSTRLQQELITAVHDLPSVTADKQSIIGTLDEAFDKWYDNPQNEHNSTVFLSHVGIDISRILFDVLEEWSPKKTALIRVLPFSTRPVDVETIRSDFENFFTNRSESTDSQFSQLEIIVIPNLNWCFLRSIEGLDGIDYLQSLLSERVDSRFWIIGMGQVAWEYLKSVCHLEAYCGEASLLPTITAENLEAWLEPIVEKLDIAFDDPRIDLQFLDGDKDNKTNYFNHLAFLSKGISVVAKQLFLHSIYHREVDNPDEETQILAAQTPRFPNLSSLESDDQYLLYSLLLHSDLTLNTLSESLGDPMPKVRARVQCLLHDGVIQQQAKVYNINPLYYLKIKQELANNNFIVGK